jgi:uncharacterized membrane protein YsdA (DUF1294 family)
MFLSGLMTKYNILSFIIFGYDKFCSQWGLWRVNETFFYMLALTGGWPGIAAGIYIFRHKNRKSTFLSKFFCSAIINVFFYGYFILFQRK